MKGPFEFEAKLHVTNGDLSAAATYTFPVGEIPTKEAIDKAFDASLEHLKDMTPEGEAPWRRMNRTEFTNAVLSDLYGGMVPQVATKDEWDK